MDYLRVTFHNELNEEGEVTIANNRFFRDQILRNLDELAYENAFEDWCNQIREDKYALADDILSHYDNEARFSRLKEIYINNSVIPFVGAGLSIPAGYPGWTEFLYKVREETVAVTEEELKQLIGGGQYEEAAGLLFDALPAGSFLEQFEIYFGVKRPAAGCVQKLPFLFESSVITTNFDTLLEEVYKESKLKAFDETLVAADADDLPRALGEGRRVLVKLHGHATTSRNRVLTRAEYEHHYGVDGKLERIVEAISSRTLLFLGCSLTFDRTLECLKSICDKKGVENVPKHYAFLKLDNPEERIERKDKLAECNIYPIWYHDDHDESLEALLEKLAE